MENAEAFLKTLGADAPEGRAWRRRVPDRRAPRRCAEARSRLPTNARAATRASSRRSEIATDRVKVEAWFRESVLSPDFLDKNFLSDDRRYPVYQLGTNIARAAGTNAMARAGLGGVLVRDLQGAARDRKNPAGSTTRSDPDKPLEWELKGGGRGYYRTPTLISMWATAPYLHNNALGMYVKDPSVRGRMLAFYDSTEKLLWPERRLGVQSIIVTSIDTELADPGPRSTRSGFPPGRRSISSPASIRARCRRSCRTGSC